MKVKQPLLYSQLAVAVSAVLKVDRNFSHTFASALDDQLQADLVANGIEIPAAFERRPPQSKEARHWIAEIGEWPRKNRGNPAIEPSQ